MRKIIFIILAFALSFLGAEVKVEKVLETTSIKEYNQWLKRNNIVERELLRIKVRSEDIKFGEEYKIFYYNSDGNIFKEEILKAKPDMWLSVHVYESAGRVVTIESPRAEGGEGGEFFITVKDSHGKAVYTFVSGDGLIDIPPIGFFKLNIAEGKMNVIDWVGAKVGEFATTVEDGFYIGRMEYVNTPDGKYTLLSLMLESPYVALWEKNEKTYREIWQKRFNSSVHLSISNDGQYSCIGDGGCVFVYDRAGALLYSFCFSKMGGTNPHSNFSPDGKFLVCALSSHMALINNKTGKPVWEIPVEGDAFKRQVFFVKNGEYIVLTHISVEKAYIYDLQGTLQATIDNVYGCSVVDDMIICGSKKKEFHKTICRIVEE